MSTHAFAPLAAALLMALAVPVRADGLADLKQALSRLQGQAPVKAQLEVKTWRRNGDGPDREGLAAFALEDGSLGMQVLYGRELLGRAEAEARARSLDRKSRTPTLEALRELDANELRVLLSAAAALQRQLDEAKFRAEAADSHDGRPARRLSFEVPIERLSEGDRKYVSKFDASFEVWIAADGTPLASRLRTQASGRAFVVIGFEQQSDEERSYAVAGDRLVLTRKHEQGKASGAGERQEYRTTTTLRLAS